MRQTLGPMIAMAGWLFFGCGTEEVAHAPFPRVMQAPSAMVTREFRDGVFEDVKRRFFAYDAQGRLVSDRTLTRDADGAWQVTQDVTLTWGTGAQLETWSDGALRKTYRYAEMSTVIPRIERVTLERKTADGWIPSGEQRMEMDAGIGRLLGVLEFEIGADGGMQPVRRLKVSVDDDKPVVVATELVRQGDEWVSNSTLTQVFREGDALHLHGVVSVDDGRTRREYQYASDGETLLGWQEFRYGASGLVPVARAAILASDSHVVTTVEEVDSVTGRWAPRRSFETFLTESGHSMFIEGPWQADATADSLVSGVWGEVYPRGSRCY
jgi:hypothetical protein